jgi:hypothetical protein
LPDGIKVTGVWSCPVRKYGGIMINIPLTLSGGSIGENPEIVSFGTNMILFKQ